jgi:hypothetical protein
MNLEVACRTNILETSNLQAALNSPVIDQF